MLGLVLFLSALTGWGFKFLPNEKWQVLGTVPIGKTPDGKWRGLNLTYYGVFNGVAVVVAVAIMMVILGAIETPFALVILFIAFTGVLAAPAAKIVARIVEKKPSTLTVGGASFVGIIAAPWIAMFVGEIGTRLGYGFINPMTLLASVSTAYAFGEGIGRLSCISFGCCYGKPVDALPGVFQKIFSRAHFVFHGKTKKIAYAHCLDEKEIVPIQAITSALYLLTGLVGVALFLVGRFALAFLVTLAITQIWRVVSELFRADYRGNGKLSVYQIMAFISLIYSIPVAFLLPGKAVSSIVIQKGLIAMWDLPVVLFLQALWVLVFFLTGRSKVISAEMVFAVRPENT